VRWWRPKVLDCVFKVENKVVMGYWVGVGMVIPISYQMHGRRIWR
jgi:hypothetical protein